jgi:hypothetical protein
MSYVLVDILIRRIYHLKIGQKMKLRPIFSLFSLSLSLFISGCGGGSAQEDGSKAQTPLVPEVTAKNFKGNFIDAPVKGLCYTAKPSGLQGKTDVAGEYEFQADDEVTFVIPNNGSCSGDGVISIGSFKPIDPSLTNNNLTHVLGLANGRRIAEVLNALNIGTVDAMDIDRLTIPLFQANRLKTYINSGTLPLDAGDNGTLMKNVQSAIALPAGKAFALSVQPLSFNVDVTKHLDATLSRVVNTGGSTIQISDGLGKLFFQAQSGGGDVSIGLFKSATALTNIGGYRQGSSGRSNEQQISVVATDKFEFVRTQNMYRVTFVQADAQKMLYTGQGEGFTDSGSVNFLTPISQADVAGKQLTFAGFNSCNGVVTDAVIDFSANGTTAIDLADRLVREVSVDSSLPGLLRLTTTSTGRVVYIGLAKGDILGVGATLFYVTAAFNPSVEKLAANDIPKRSGSFKIKDNPIIPSACEREQVPVAKVVEDTGNGISVFRAAGGASVQLKTGAVIFEGDILTSGNNKATVEFSDKSTIRLDTNVTVEIRTKGINLSTIAEGIVADGRLWGRILTNTGFNLGGSGLVAGVRG